MIVSLFSIVTLVVVTLLILNLYIIKRFFKHYPNSTKSEVFVEKLKIFTNAEKKYILDKFTNLNNFQETNFSSGKKVIATSFFRDIKVRLQNKVKQLNIKEKVIVGEPFFRLYSSKKDHITWHYDGNYTTNKKYTMVCLLDKNECNTSEFQYMDRKSKKVHTVHLKIDDVVYYEGDHTFHRITDQQEGCYRLVLVCPLYTSKTTSLLGYFEKWLVKLSSILNIHI